MVCISVGFLSYGTHFSCYFIHGYLYGVIHRCTTKLIGGLYKKAGIIVLMKNDEFTKLFKYMTERFDKIDKALETKSNDEDMQKVLDLLDSLAKRQEISDDERLVMGHQLDRLDRWTHELAGKIGYTLST